MPTHILASMRKTATLEASAVLANDALRAHITTMARIEVRARNAAPTADLQLYIAAEAAALGERMRELLRQDIERHKAIELRSYADEVEA